jgi:IclR family acetate operon transcriptional repressor
MMAAHENHVEAKTPPGEPPIDGDTPALRLFALLEVIARKDQFFSLQGLVEETGLPKPTLHRMLQQLESAGMLQRAADGRHYGTGLRLRRLAEDLLLNNTVHGARHGVLRRLVDEVGESCNITALSAARCSTSTASRPRRRCASTCIRARACRRTARPAASSSWRR